MVIKKLKYKLLNTLILYSIEYHIIMNFLKSGLSNMNVSIFFNFSGYIIVTVSTVATVYLSYAYYRKMKAKKYNDGLIGQNIIPIVHKNGTAKISNLLNTGDMIDTNTHTTFIKMYNSMDKDKDIHIILHTLGRIIIFGRSYRQLY